MDQEDLERRREALLRRTEEFKEQHPDMWKEARRKINQESSRRYLLGQKRKKRRGG